jgi:hypothetical protein
VFALTLNADLGAKFRKTSKPKIQTSEKLQKPNYQRQSRTGAAGAEAG